MQMEVRPAETARAESARPLSPGAGSDGYRTDAGSDGYRTDSAAGTEGYSFGARARAGGGGGTDGYPGHSGTEGYRLSETGNRTAPVRPLIVRGDLQVFPLRSRGEFGSVEEYFDYLEEVNRYNNNLPPRNEEREHAPRTTASVAEYRQLGLKLAVPDYERLAAAAKARRLRPTTLARVLVIAGLKSSD